MKDKLFYKHIILYASLLLLPIVAFSVSRSSISGIFSRKISKARLPFMSTEVWHMFLTGIVPSGAIRVEKESRTYVQYYNPGIKLFPGEFSL